MGKTTELKDVPDAEHVRIVGRHLLRTPENEHRFQEKLPSDGKKRINIVGKGTGWWNSPCVGEVWGVNDLCVKHDGVSLAFEIHNIEKFLDTAVREVRYVKAFRMEVEKIAKKGIPVMIQEPHPLLPHGVVFPIDEMPFRYFTNTIAFMIAYAIHQGADIIDLYGAPMYYEEEYVFERPCIEFWLGYAMGKGIEVNVHKPSYILTTAPNYGVYAYDWGYRYTADQNKHTSLIKGFK